MCLVQPSLQYKDHLTSLAVACRGGQSLTVRLSRKYGYWIYSADLSSTKVAALRVDDNEKKCTFRFDFGTTELMPIDEMYRDACNVCMLFVFVAVCVMRQERIL